MITSLPVGVKLVVKEPVPVPSPVKGWVECYFLRSVMGSHTFQLRLLIGFGGRF